MHTLSSRLWPVSSFLLGHPIFNDVEKSTWYPAFEVISTEQGVNITADLPGVKPEALDISVQGTTLTIKGSRKDFGSFTKSYQISENLDSEALTAKLEDGVLTVTIGKMPKAQPRKIAVLGPKQDAS